MSDDFYGNDSALAVQEKVLADDTLSENAKLAFCRLNCKDSFRFGWIICDSKWTLEDRKSFAELESRGYIYVKDDNDGGVGLIPLNVKPN
jgi:hypothetical protein